jgi:hypothetical protein
MKHNNLMPVLLGLLLADTLHLHFDVGLHPEAVANALREAQEQEKGAG